MPPSAEETRRLLCALGEHVRALVIGSRGMDMAAVAGETVADTIYAIDRVADDALLRWFEEHWTDVLVVSEGLDEPVLVGNAAAWTVIVDTIDGTRGLMYDKRPAWCLAAAAPPGGASGGHRGGGHDRTAHRQARRGRSIERHAAAAACVAERIKLTGGKAAALQVRPSAATDLEHSFSGLAKFFLPGKAALAELEAELCNRLGARHVFDDQYLSTGGQLHELITGRDRFVADLRPLVIDDGLVCHPYDVCTVHSARRGRWRGHRPLERPAVLHRWTTSRLALGHLRQRDTGEADRPRAGGAGGRPAVGVARRAFRSDKRCDGLFGSARAGMPTRHSMEVVAAPATPPWSSAQPPSRPPSSGAWPASPTWTSGGSSPPMPRWTHYVIGVAVLLLRQVCSTLSLGGTEIASDLRRRRQSHQGGALGGDGPALGVGPSIRSAWRRCARRPRTTWWVHPAGSWIRSRWSRGGRGPCCPSCAARPRWPIRSRCRGISRSWAGRREPPTVSVACRTSEPGRRPSWASAWWKTPPGGSGPGSASCQAPPSRNCRRTLDGHTFLAAVGRQRRRRHDIRPDESYPVRAATQFGVQSTCTPGRSWRHCVTTSRSDSGH